MVYLIINSLYYTVVYQMDNVVYYVLQETNIVSFKVIFKHHFTYSLYENTLKKIQYQLKKRKKLYFCFLW